MEYSVKDLAHRLDELQKNENDGRGISCVKSIISCLRRGDVESAKMISQHDHGKIGNYPEIEQLLSDVGFCKTYAESIQKWNSLLESK